jgi:hypothetical protein
MGKEAVSDSLYLLEKVKVKVEVKVKVYEVNNKNKRFYIQ